MEAASRLTGETAAQTAMGKRLLVGDGTAADPKRGAAMIVEAARQGDGEAAALVSVLIGLGAHTMADWTKALEYLQQAAESGWVPAQRQLMALCVPALVEEAQRPSPPPDTWGRLRRSIDVATWYRLPELRPALAAPRIELRDAFLPPRICGWLIERARSRLERSRVFASGGMGEIDKARTNSAFEFDLLSLDVVLLLTRAKVAAAAGFAP